ncbi:TPA: hypothetical protein N0F65_008061 [Lagenidium giganteum]|uniref:Uncharacterized protein n=1 Tax=Lagenidium giganteum TaxID=4803 RepID=A0AAV2YQZ2_9STRA|nr:TPA: hypothetical protein N0F65_008061 [Lagenidium giganteum]
MRRLSDEPRVEITGSYEKYQAKELRKECSRRHISIIRSGPYANDCKQGYILLLRAHDRERTGGSTDGSQAGEEPPEERDESDSDGASSEDNQQQQQQQQRQQRYRRSSMFRLINVIARCCGSSHLDGPEADDDTTELWNDIAHEYCSNNHLYDKLYSANPLWDNVDPHVFDELSGTTLRRMWSELCTSYTRTMADDRLDQHSAHAVEQSDVERQDVMYLHDQIQLYPNGPNLLRRFVQRSSEDVAGVPMPSEHMNEHNSASTQKINAPPPLATAVITSVQMKHTDSPTAAALVPPPIMIAHPEVGIRTKLSQERIDVMECEISLKKQKAVREELIELQQSIRAAREEWIKYEQFPEFRAQVLEDLNYLQMRKRTLREFLDRDIDALVGKKPCLHVESLHEEDKDKCL